MEKIALVTSSNVRHTETSDSFVFITQAILEDISVDLVNWDDRSIDWSIYNMIIIDSTWDYHRRNKDFEYWLISLSKSNSIILNPPEIILWNMKKSYLHDLQESGFKIPKTLILDKLDLDRITTTFPPALYSHLIYKPEISASAYLTYLLSL